MGELQKRLKERVKGITESSLLSQKDAVDSVLEIVEEMKKEFYEVWNNAYGSSAQQGIDIHNKWFLKWFEDEV